MNKITLSMAALAMLALVGLDTNVAQAAHGFGLHIGGRNVHLDIGNPHGYNRSYSNYGHVRQVAYRSSRSYCPSDRRRAHYDWHDTSHYDYVPGGFVRHGNHFDYRPGRYIWHQEGHYDRHDGRHGGRH